MPEERAKPLSNDDVNRMMKICAQIKDKELVEIFNDFNNTLNSVISLAFKLADNDYEVVELERLKRLLKLFPQEEKFLRVKDKVWLVREHILKRNADYFLKKDYSGNIKKDHNKAFIEKLIDHIISNYDDLSEQSKNQYWKKAAELLKTVIRFKKLLKKHNAKI